MMFCMVSVITAQKIASGRVIDENNGEPIIGVAVMEYGTTNGTTNNKDSNADLPDKADCGSNEHKQGEDGGEFEDTNHREGCNLEHQERQDMRTGYNTSSGSPVNHSHDLDNCSSCPSEGDSSISSSSGPHHESSSSTSDSEDASQQSDGRDNSTCTSEKNDSNFPKDLPNELGGSTFIVGGWINEKTVCRPAR